MADNVAITPGSGAQVATDDVGGIQYQRVKLDGGGDGLAAPILGDSTNGLDVDITRVQYPRIYRGATAALLVAAAGTAPFWAMQGSASQTVRLKRLCLSGLSLTAVAQAMIRLGKYSSAITVGTATALVKVPLDANDAASTLNLLNVYTAAPTAGALIGYIGALRPLMQATVPAAGGVPDLRVEWDFRQAGDDRSGLLLRGIAQGLALSFEVAPASAVSMSVECEWTEE